MKRLRKIHIYWKTVVEHENRVVGLGLRAHYSYFGNICSTAPYPYVGAGIWSATTMAWWSKSHFLLRISMPEYSSDVVNLVAQSKRIFLGRVLTSPAQLLGLIVPRTEVTRNSVVEDSFLSQVFMKKQDGPIFCDWVGAGACYEDQMEFLR